jgi:hypothetical protein
MFALTLVDHLRLTFGHVIYTHRAHAQAAYAYGQRDRWIKAGEAGLLLVAATTSTLAAARNDWRYALVAAIAATIAVALLLLRLALDWERTASVHRDCAARLWHIREQYRALLADHRDGALTVEQARASRDALMETLQRIYEYAPPADRDLYEAARKSLPSVPDAALSDEEIDRFLPASLRKKDSALRAS